MDIPEISELKTISSNFKNLGFTNLLKEETICAEKSKKLLAEIDDKLEIVQALDEQIQELEDDIEVVNENIEVLDVEIIRIKTQVKKAEKQIGKLESMNTSKVKIDASESDKLKIRKNLTKLSIVKKLTGLQLNKDGKGFIIDNDGQIKDFQINKNKSKEAINDQLWNEINQCSKYKDEWQTLFQSQAQPK
ncbi:hypothetical protein PVAND_004901 [Polypedilum vanderplanki]|uniref:Uncharacterized protein n=1 Tax=Polypedilum vanderplanki TaxID=319348 RepID=A0A9J6BZG3_POLVA|nr:hypothetical protein PVAND_004901 [Polypedilum vanderplanki]